MKKILITIIIVMCIFILSGCRGNKKVSKQEVEENNQTPQVEETVVNGNTTNNSNNNNNNNNITNIVGNVINEENVVKKISSEDATKMVYNICLQKKTELAGKNISFMQPKIETINGEEVYFVQAYEDFVDHISTIGYYYVTLDGKKIYEKNLVTAANELIWIDNTQQNTSYGGGMQASLGFEDSLVNYIYNSIREYTKDGYILKNTNGNDFVNPVLTVEEVEKNENNYKNQIKEMLKDKTIFSDVFVKNDKKACTYKFERLLNRLDLGALNGVGIGCYDGNGNKIYEYGKTIIEKTGPGNKNAIEYFGYTIDKVSNVILEEMKNYAKSGYLVKTTKAENSEQSATEETKQNNNSMQKLNSQDFDKNIELYRGKINTLIDESGYAFVYFKNADLICEVDFDGLLAALELQIINNQMTNLGIRTFVIR